jgi:hypothetical protein
MPEIPEDPMFNMKPNSLIYGARYDRMMEAFGGKGFFVEDPKDLRGTLDEAMNFRGPALVNVVISQGSPANPSSSAGTAERLTAWSEDGHSRVLNRSTNRGPFRKERPPIAQITVVRLGQRVGQKSAVVPARWSSTPIPQLLPVCLAVS